MLTMTHTYIAKNTLIFLESKELDIINKKTFIYGNIKPDNLFQKTPKKHLYDESIDFIVHQIEVINELDIENNKKLISLELGIVCHFLCDYFCLPHFERWSDSTGMNKAVATAKHLNYEKNLHKYIDNTTMEHREISNVMEFLEECQKSYKSAKTPEEDIKYASFVCNSVALHILDKHKQKLKKT